MGYSPRRGLVAGRSVHSPLSAKVYSMHSNFITPADGKFKGYWYNPARERVSMSGKEVRRDAPSECT